jgi:hypothetical protein
MVADMIHGFVNRRINLRVGKPFRSMGRLIDAFPQPLRCLGSGCSSWSRFVYVHGDRFIVTQWPPEKAFHRMPRVGRQFSYFT